jgi:Zn-dependent protease
VKWSWKIAQVRGLGIYLHITFLLLLGWIVLDHLRAETSWHNAWHECLFVLLVLGTLVLHELAHALAAARFGIRTRDVTLLPIGGVARLERLPEGLREELTIALAGPLVNLLLAGGLLGCLWAEGFLTEAGQPRLFSGGLLPRLFWFNIALFAFNLVPAFPMDGGRVLQALLGLWMGPIQATRMAAAVGQLLALAFGFVGLFSNPLLVFIALFLWIGAGQEAGLVQVKAAVSGIPASRVMARDFRALAPSDTLRTASEYILAGFPQDFPVVQDGKLVGLLTRAGLLAALAKHGSDARVGDVMQREFEVAGPTEMLDEVLHRLQESACRTLPVLRNAQLVGMISLENLGEFLLAQSARRARAG